MGATDTELARFFGISRSTFYLWRLNYPEFSDALRAGKMPADDRVERSFYERAIGYDHESVKTVEEQVFGEDGKPTLVKRTTTTQTQHVREMSGLRKAGSQTASPNSGATGSMSLLTLMRTRPRPSYAWKCSSS